MPKLTGYNSFDGRHWETGSVHNYYAYRNVIAPHTGQPYSEALFLGVSGGIVMAYFSFAYQGYDPHVALLTRNTFDPLDTFLERLGVVQHVEQTSKPDRAVANLTGALESGLPAIVWADVFSLPYNPLPFDDDMWLMYPILVYGYEPDDDLVWIADRSSVPLTITTGELAEARGRVKKDKYRVLTLGDPNPEKLASAVTKGIWDTITLFTDKPPRGSRENFGFAAYQRWSNLLVNPKLSGNWAKVFPPGRPMIAGLSSAFWRITENSVDGDAERSTYADFLDEASLILHKDSLREAGELFRRSAPAWKELACALLPDEVEPFKEIRELMLSEQRLFLERGGAARAEIQAINDRIETIKSQVAADFPLDESGTERLLENLRVHILKVHDIEREAVSALQAAMMDG